MKGGTQKVDAMCPLKQFKVRNSEKPWFSNELLEQIKDKDRALRKAKRSGTSEDWKLARRLRHDFLRDVRRAKTSFLQNELNINWNDSKTFWQQINEAKTCTIPLSATTRYEFKMFKIHP